MRYKSTVIHGLLLNLQYVLANDNIVDYSNLMSKSMVNVACFYLPYPYYFKRNRPTLKKMHRKLKEFAYNTSID